LWGLGLDFEWKESFGNDRYFLWKLIHRGNSLEWDASGFCPGSLPLKKVKSGFDENRTGNRNRD